MTLGSAPLGVCGVLSCLITNNWDSELEPIKDAAKVRLTLELGYRQIGNTT